MDVKVLLLLLMSLVLPLLLTFVIYIYLNYSRKEYKWPWKRSDESSLVILFIDAPDPDNPAAAVATFKHVVKPSEKQSRLHIVLTGRPVDFRTPKKFRDDSPISEQIPRQSWEETNKRHAQLLLKDSAARISGYLAKCKVDLNCVTIYDGGIAQCAPLSDVAHDWDFLYDRKDLFTRQESDKGDILSPSEYQDLISKFNKLSPSERECEFVSLMRPYQLAQLDELQVAIESNSCKQVTIFLGGPATAVVKLFHGKEKCEMREKVTKFYGMFGAINPGSETLLDNQFNVACDVESACILFVDNLFPHVQKYLITTETAKDKNLMVTADELKALGINNYVVELQKLWEFTHQNKAQPLFDLLPVMASLEECKNCFKWSMKKAILMEFKGTKSESRKFIFLDSDSDNLLVSQEYLRSTERDDFLQFLHKTWQ